MNNPEYMHLDFQKIQKLSDANNLQNRYNGDWQWKILNFLSEFLNDKNFIIVKTSGSTGKPESIKLEKDKMLCSAQSTGTFFGFKEGQTSLLCLSPDFIAGKMMVVRAIYWKMHLLCIKKSSNPLQKLKEKIDFIPMVPMQLDNTIEQNPEKLNLVSTILIGGAPVSLALRKKIRLLSCKVYESFGMTETLSHIAIRRLNGKNTESFFSALPHVKIAKDKRNCLQVEAPFLTEKIQTNDLVEIKAGNQFRWLGRYDNLINSGGIKHIPEVLESKIENIIDFPYYITSKPDEKLGERMVLMVETDSLNKTEILKKIEVALTKYEVPKEIICQPVFSRTQNGKPIRKKPEQYI